MIVSIQRPNARRIGHADSAEFTAKVPDAAEPRPPYMLRKAIEAVKAAVRIEDYAGTATALRFAGNTLRGRCPVHKGGNPEAFAVYPSEGRFFCFRCNVGGDVIDLCRRVEGGELTDALVSLSMRYDVPLPRRGATWHRAQSDKARIREAAASAVARSRQRRLAKVFAPLVLVGGQSPEEERRELRELARSLWPVCLDMARREVYGDG